MAHEKLIEDHGFSFSVETLRQWMISDGLWHPKSKKHKRAFQMRERRSCFGEMIQIDGSPHDWFEGRAAKCTLIVFIGYAMRGTAVTVCEDFQGNVTLLYKGKVLTYETWKRGRDPPAIRDSKEINQAVDQAIRSQDQRKAWKPAPDHPWRKLELGHTQKRKFLLWVDKHVVYP